MIALALLCVVLAASSADGACDCSKVNCKNYKFEITPFHKTYYGECRFMIRDDNKNLKDPSHSGLQIYKYHDKPMHLGGIWQKTRDCPVKKAKGITKLLMTSSPRGVDFDSLIGPKVFKDCCVRPVIRKCHYHVKIFMNCHNNTPMPTDPKGNDRRDDELLKMVVVYRVVVNKKPNGKKGHFEKLVWVTFDPKKKSVSCKNNFNKLESELKKEDGAKAVKYCGDKEINVTLMRYRAQYANGYKYTMLKCQRYECNSQYAAMFTDPIGFEKFTMRTQLTGRDPVMSAVFAQTKKHACGPIVESVKYIPPVLGP